MCKSCNWCVYFLIDRKSGNCGSTDICYSVCFYMMNGISSFFSEGALSTCVTFGLLILAAAIIIYTMIKNFLISAVICVVGEIALVIVYVVNSSFFSGGIQKILDIFNLSTILTTLQMQSLMSKAFLYFVSVIAVCLFLTVQSIAKRRWN